ncbi:MAG: DegT/DnrJ/EryC1/StrS family aminotransferase [Candidatus Aenigmarchaeota archaeon]|nr:DegT/DnrJ/EryC1/StrS family aminotransferase [Candidatus Aenigmarchaeota archaeon]
MDYKIPLMKHVVNDEMKEAVLQILEEQKPLVFGDEVFKFEEEFARYIGTKYAVSLSSGTDALNLSVIALGVKQKDKVITTTNSFIASANCIQLAGAVPVLTDIEPNTGNIDIKKMKTNGAKGIIPVHLYGNPCKIEDIINIAKEEGMFVIEDACQSHGSAINGKKLGSFGDIACFSFYPSKNITVGGDGGIVTTNNDDLANKIASLRDGGRETKGTKRSSHYIHTEIGINARLNTINAAIGRIQLKHLDEWNNERRKIAGLYSKFLPKEVLLNTASGSCFYMFAIKTPLRDKVMAHLAENGIKSGIHYPIPIHLQPIYMRLYGYKKGDFPIAEQFCSQILSIPLFHGITEEQIKIVAEKINEVLENA